MRSNQEIRLLPDVSQKESPFLQLNFDLTFTNEIQSCIHNEGTSCIPFPSGEWRANIMLEDFTQSSTRTSLSLRHLTSFEEKSMENHGKILKRAWENCLYFIRPSSSQTQPKQIVYDGQAQICEALCHIPNLAEDKKTSLLEFTKGKVQGQLVLRQILKNMGSQSYPYCLSITKELFDYYENSNVDKMEEDQIESFVELNYSKLGEKLKEVIGGPKIHSDNPEDELNYLEMIRTWMQTVFFALNGVFENPDERKTPFEELEGYETFYTARKLAKTD